MSYLVELKERTHFVINESSGKVEGTFHKKSHKENKAEADALASELAEKEKQWRKTVKTTQ